LASLALEFDTPRVSDPPLENGVVVRFEVMLALSYSEIADETVVAFCVSISHPVLLLRMP
jgi:hypothetical protein